MPPPPHLPRPMHNMIIIHIPLFVNSLCTICPRIVQNFRIPPSIFCRNQHNLPFLPLFCTGFPLSVPVGHPPFFYKSCIFCAFFRHTCTHNIHNFQDHPEKTPSACRFLSGAAKPGTPAGARRQRPLQRETPGVSPSTAKPPGMYSVFSGRPFIPPPGGPAGRGLPPAWRWARRCAGPRARSRGCGRAGCRG